MKNFPIEAVERAIAWLSTVPNDLPIAERAGIALSELNDAEAVIDTLVRAAETHDAVVAALRKLHDYNIAIRDGKINYRPQDHIDVASAALAAAEKGQS